MGNILYYFTIIMFFISRVFLLFILFLISFIFTTTKNSFLSTFLVIIICGLISLLITNFSMSWFFYATIVIYIRGIIIVFAYASSITSIFKFELKFSKSFFVIYLVLFFLLFEKKILQSIRTSFIYPDIFIISNIVVIISIIIFILCALFVSIKFSRFLRGPLKL